jgi:hypothetical protein
MKKSRLKTNKCHIKNSEKCTDDISMDGVHPLLFCSHTWTKCVPISVSCFLLYVSFMTLKNVMYIYFNIIHIIASSSSDASVDVNWT